MGSWKHTMPAHSCMTSSRELLLWVIIVLTAVFWLANSTIVSAEQWWGLVLLAVGYTKPMLVELTYKFPVKQ